MSASTRSSAVAGPIDYMLKRWGDFARFVEDGRICLTNNAAERNLRGLALGRRAWLFAGSERGAERAAVVITLIITARLNEVDPQAWLADIFARIADLPQSRLHEFGSSAPPSRPSPRLPDPSHRSRLPPRAPPTITGRPRTDTLRPPSR